MIDSESFLRSHPVVIRGADEPAEIAVGPTDRASAETVSVSAAPVGRRDPDGESGLGGRAGWAADDSADERCMSSAIKSLEAAGASSEGLRERLLRKDFDASSVDGVILALEKMRLLDDDAYAEGLLRKGLDKMMGAYGVQREMAQKKVDPALAAQVVATARAEGLFAEAAGRLVVDSLARSTGQDAQARLRRLYSAARRKGHTTSDIQSALADHHL